jgi:hypothetical protein
MIRYNDDCKSEPIAGAGALGGANEFTDVLMPIAVG